MLSTKLKAVIVYQPKVCPGLYGLIHSINVVKEHIIISVRNLLVLFLKKFVLTKVATRYWNICCRLAEMAEFGSLRV